MPNYQISARDGQETAEGVESHASMEAAHRSAVRSAIGILLEARELEGPLQASITVRDEAQNVSRLVRVSVLISHTIERDSAG